MGRRHTVLHRLPSRQYTGSARTPDRIVPRHVRRCHADLSAAPASWTSTAVHASQHAAASYTLPTTLATCASSLALAAHPTQHAVSTDSTSTSAQPAQPAKPAQPSTDCRRMVAIWRAQLRPAARGVVRHQQHRHVGTSNRSAQR